MRSCLLVLANLSMSVAHHEALMLSGLKTIAAFSTHRDVKCRQHAVFCLGNLSSNPLNTAQILKSKCLRTMISYAFPSREVAGHVQYQAIAGLRGLSSQEAHCIQMINEGVLEPLLIAVEAEEVEVRREAAATLMNLSLSKVCILPIVSAGSLAILKRFLLHPDPGTRSFAMAAVANLSEAVEESGMVHERMFYEGFIKALVKLGEEAIDDIDTLRQVSRCFSLLASRTKSHRPLIESGVAIPAVAALIKQSADTELIRFGTVAIANLAVSPSSHAAIQESGILQAFAALSSSTDVETKKALAHCFHHFSSSPTNHPYCEQIYLAHYVCLLINDECRDVYLQAVLAARKLAVCPTNAHHIVYYHGVANLSAHALKDDIEVRREVGAALRNLALHDVGKLNVVSSNALPPLYELMHSADTDTCYQSVVALANVCELLEKQSAVISSGALQHLKFVSRSK